MRVVSLIVGFFFLREPPNYMLGCLKPNDGNVNIYIYCGFDNVGMRCFAKMKICLRLSENWIAVWKSFVLRLVYLLKVYPALLAITMKEANVYYAYSTLT